MLALIYDITLDPGDIIAISEAVLLTGTWVWVLHATRKWIGFREKAALAALLCASLAVVSDIALTAVMHFDSESMFAGKFYVATLLGASLLGVVALILGIIGKGTARVASLIWSLIVLVGTIVTFFSIVSQMGD